MNNENTEVITSKDAMSVKDIAEQRKEVFSSVYGVDRMVDILKKFEKDYNKVKNTSVPKTHELFGAYSYAIFFMYSPSSIRNNLVRFKKVIEANGGKYQDIALKSFNVSSIYAPVKKRDEERKREKKDKLVSGESLALDKSVVNVVKNRINELKSTLDNKEYMPINSNQNEAQVRAYYIVAILGLSTGRRFTELLKTLKISKRKDVIYFQGLLKGNDKKIEGNIIELDYKDVQKYLRELRKFVELPEDSTEADVNNKYAKVFNNALKRLGFTNIKTLRYNYSVSGAQIFKKYKETPEDTITRILGHTERFTSALSYT